MRMIKIYSPENDMDLAFVRGILDAENIHYHVQNDHFGTMKTGPRIDLYNTKHILVGDDNAEYAKALITGFLNSRLSETEPGKDPKAYNLFDKIRMTIEMIFFNWFVPGRSSKTTQE